MTQSFLFPINAVLSESATGFIEFKCGKDIFVRNVKGKDARCIKAIGEPVSSRDMTRVIDVRGIRQKVRELEDAKYLVVSVQKDDHISLALSETSNI